MNQRRKRVTDAETLAYQCVKVCEGRKARDVVLFDVRESSVLADFYLVCTGSSEPQIRAIAHHLAEELAEAGLRTRLEGRAVSRWVVMDSGVVVIHVMDPALRAYYRLEELWDPAQIVYRSPEAP